MTGSPFVQLTRREREVLRMVAGDKTDREIGRLLGIGERTVRAHVSRIILKLGVISRVGAAVVFAEWRTRQECRCCGHSDGCSDTVETPMVAAGPGLSGFTQAGRRVTCGRSPAEGSALAWGDRAGSESG